VSAVANILMRTAFIANVQAPETRPSHWRDKTAFSRSRRRRRTIIARISSIYDSPVPPI
jgi:hypothetical protein